MDGLKPVPFRQTRSPRPLEGYGLQAVRYYTRTRSALAAEAYDLLELPHSKTLVSLIVAVLVRWCFDQFNDEAHGCDKELNPVSAIGDGRFWFCRCNGAGSA